MASGLPEGVDKRERLLDWMRGGDPEKVPIMIGPGHYVAASYLDKPMAEVTYEMVARTAVETGTENMLCVGSPLPFSAIPFTDKLSRDSREEVGADGVPRRVATITTPRGSLHEVWAQDEEHGSVHSEFFVKGPEDLPAFESFIRIACQTILDDPEVRQAVLKEMREFKAAGGDFFPTNIWVFCPAVELTSSYYMDQATAIYTLHDYPELMEDLFDLHWKTTEIWLELGREIDVDMFGYAINGLEWLSPEWYERYMIPQARRINDIAHSMGKLAWLHTCGKKRGLIERDVYRRMGVDLLESLSAAPTGDIEDYTWARNSIGPEITTRGGVNCELFYSEDVDQIRQHVHRVLDGCRGFRHMIGDTNGSVPPYTWETIQVLVDTVRERGAAFSD